MSYISYLARHLKILWVWPIGAINVIYDKTLPIFCEKVCII